MTTEHGLVSATLTWQLKRGLWGIDTEVTLTSSCTCQCGKTLALHSQSVLCSDDEAAALVEASLSAVALAHSLAARGHRLQENSGDSSSS